MGTSENKRIREEGREQVKSKEKAERNGMKKVKRRKRERVGTERNEREEYGLLS